MNYQIEKQTSEHNITVQQTHYCLTHIFTKIPGFEST